MSVRSWGVGVSSKNRRKASRKPPVPAAHRARGDSEHESKSAKKYAIAAVGIIATAVLTLVGTSLLPKIAGQFFNTAKLEDNLRHGPDIIVNESLFYPNEGVPLPTVVTGNYHPSRELVAALARPMGATSPSVEKQIREAGGVDIEDIFIRVVLHGNRNEPILILGVRPVELRRGKPLNGVLFEIGAQGENGNIQMGFDLDRLAPEAVKVADTGSLTTAPYFESHSISLTDREPAVLVIAAKTRCYSAQFKLAVDYMVGNQTKHEVITNNGKPFMVSAYRYDVSNVMAYRRIFALQGNFSAIQPSHAQLAHYDSRTPEEARECPA